MRFAEAPQRATRRPRECERTRQRSECGCRHGRGIPATRGPIGRASAPSAGPEPADSPKYSCMRITFLGHAGFFVETRHGSVLCDPWFTPAYFGSWFPFPRNDRLDPAEFGRARLPLRLAPASRPLRPRVPRLATSTSDARVLLPGVRRRRSSSGSCATSASAGSSRTRTAKPVDLDGLEVTIFAMTDARRRAARRLGARARRRHARAC